MDAARLGRLFFSSHGRSSGHQRVRAGRTWGLGLGPMVDRPSLRPISRSDVPGHDIPPWTVNSLQPRPSSIVNGTDGHGHTDRRPGLLLYADMKQVLHIVFTTRGIINIQVCCIVASWGRLLLFHQAVLLLTQGTEYYGEKKYATWPHPWTNHAYTMGTSAAPDLAYYYLGRPIISRAPPTHPLIANHFRSRTA